MAVSDFLFSGGFNEARLVHFLDDSEEHGRDGFLWRFFLFSHAS